MKNSRVIFVVVAAFIIGGVIGAYIEHRHSVKVISNMQVSDQFYQIVGGYIALRDLRSGETNGAFAQMESDLDYAVVSLNSAIEKNPSADCAINYYPFLRTVAKYRATYPYHDDDTNMDIAVRAALAKLSKERVH